MPEPQPLQFIDGLAFTMRFFNRGRIRTHHCCAFSNKSQVRNGYGVVGPDGVQALVKQRLADMDCRMVRIRYRCSPLSGVLHRIGAVKLG